MPHQLNCFRAKQKPPAQCHGRTRKLGPPGPWGGWGRARPCSHSQEVSTESICLRGGLFPHPPQVPRGPRIPPSHRRFLPAPVSWGPRPLLPLPHPRPQGHSPRCYHTSPNTFLLKPDAYHKPSFLKKTPITHITGI